MYLTTSNDNPINATMNPTNINMKKPKLLLWPELFSELLFISIMTVLFDYCLY